MAEIKNRLIVEVETSDALKKIKELKDSLDELNDTNDTVNDTVKKVTKSNKDLEKSAKDVNKANTEGIPVLDQLNKGFSRFNSTLKKNPILAVISLLTYLWAAFRAGTELIRALTGAFGKNSKAIDENKQKIKELEEAHKKAEKGIDEFNKSLEQKYKLMKAEDTSALDINLAKQDDLNKRIAQAVQLQLQAIDANNKFGTALKQQLKDNISNTSPYIKLLQEELQILKNEEEVIRVSTGYKARQKTISDAAKSQSEFNALAERYNELLKQQEFNQLDVNTQYNIYSTTIDELKQKLKDGIINTDELRQLIDYTQQLSNISVSSLIDTEALDREYQEVSNFIKDITESIKNIPESDAGLNLWQQLFNKPDDNFGADDLFEAINGIQTLLSDLENSYQDDADAQISAINAKMDGLDRESKEYKSLEKEREKVSKEAFEKSKNAQIAQATINMFASAVSAFNSLASIPIVGTGLGIAAAAAAIALGVKNINSIKQTQYNKGGGGTSSVSEQSQASISPVFAEMPQPEITTEDAYLAQQAYQTENINTPETVPVLVVEDLSEVNNKITQRVQISNF